MTGAVPEWLGRAALVVVDLQRRVVALETAPSSSEEVVTRARDLAGAFRAHGLPVIFVRTVNLDRPDPVGDELVDRLEAEPGDVQVTKHQWSAFHGTPLDVHLRRSGVAGIALSGLMTNFGVESTGRVADELGYRVAFVEDAMASLTADCHRFAVEEIFRRLGDVLTTEQLARALGAQGLERDEAPEQRTRLPTLARPRVHPRLPGRGRVGAADARGPRGLPSAGGVVRVRPAAQGSSRFVRSLWAIRWKLGGLLGWDGPDAGVGSRVPTLRGRLPVDLRDGASGPEFHALPFTSLYLIDDEWAAEIANRTMHGVMHIGWVPDKRGGYRGQMAVLVKPNGLLGTGYMAAIRPFRHLIVYPAMMREIERDWRARVDDRTPPPA